MKQLSMRKQQAMDTKKRILDVALDMMIEKGYDNININDICKKAGVSTGALYHHLKSKEGIIIEAYRNADDYFIEKVINNLEGEGPIARIIEYLEYQGGYACNMGVDFVINVYKAQINNGNEFFLSSERGLPKGLQQLVEEAQQAGDLTDKISSAQIKDELLIISRGIIYNWCQCKGQYDLIQKIRSITAKYIQAFKE